MKSGMLKSKYSVLVGIATGVVISVVIMLIAGLVGTNMILKEIMPVKYMDLLSVAVIFVSSVLGNIVSVNMIVEKKILYSIIFSAVLSLILVICGMLFYDGMSVRALWNVLIVVVSGFLSLLISAGSIRKKKYKKTRHC